MALLKVENLKLFSENESVLGGISFEIDKKGIYAIGNSCSYVGKVKTIMSGMGEAVSAITAIHQYIYPTKNPTFYTSINAKSKSYNCNSYFL